MWPWKRPSTASVMLDRGFVNPPLRLARVWTRNGRSPSPNSRSTHARYSAVPRNGDRAAATASHALGTGRSPPVAERLDRHRHRDDDAGRSVQARQDAERDHAEPAPTARGQEDADREGEEDAFRVAEHQHERRRRQRQEPRAALRDAGRESLAPHEEDEQGSGRQRGQVRDDDHADPRPDAEPTHRSAEQRGQGEESQGRIGERGVAVLGDVGVERAVPREQPLADRPVRECVVEVPVLLQPTGGEPRDRHQRPGEDPCRECDAHGREHVGAQGRAGG